MASRLVLTGLLGMAALVLAACSGDSDASEPDVGTPPGTVTVDSVTYEITEVVNCQPYDHDPVVAELEMWGQGEHDGEVVRIDVVIMLLGDIRVDGVSWLGPEGYFSSEQDATVDYHPGAGTVSGSVTAQDSWAPAQTVTVTFNLEVPAELTACR